MLSPSDAAFPRVLDCLSDVLERLGCPRDSVQKSVTQLAESASVRAYSSGEFLFRALQKVSGALQKVSGSLQKVSGTIFLL